MAESYGAAIKLGGLWGVVGCCGLGAHLILLNADSSGHCYFSKMLVRFPLAAFCLILGLAAALAQDLPQTPVAAAADIFRFQFAEPRGSIKVLDDNNAQIMVQSRVKVYVTRKSDCVYRMSDRGFQLDFSKLTGYQQGHEGGFVATRLYLVGERGMFCYVFQGTDECTNEMQVLFAHTPGDILEVLRAVQFIQGFCPSQVPF